MTSTDVKEAGGVGGIAAAVIALLVGFEAVHWSTAQVALVSACTAAGLILAGSIYAHFRPSTGPEPVAVAGALSAFAPTFIGTLVGFQVLTWTDEQIGLVLGLVALVVGYVGTKLARDRVTPTVEVVDG